MNISCVAPQADDRVTGIRGAFALVTLGLTCAEGFLVAIRPQVGGWAIPKTEKATSCRCPELPQGADSAWPCDVLIERRMAMRPCPGCD